MKVVLMLSAISLIFCSVSFGTFLVLKKLVTREKTHKNFAILKKFFKIYINDFPHASEMREKMMETNSAEEVEEILRTIQ